MSATAGRVTPMRLNTAEELIEDIGRGRMVILMDDEDRENEGDLIMAASYVRAEDINFMARYGRGLICLTLTRERCRQLHLPLMVDHTDSRHLTNFTVSIEAARGITTGISAADRATTIRAAVAAGATAADLTQPGHVFPLMAQPGGVLTRAGHTEAGSDLARLAGLEPASVIVEVLNEDGTMARRPDLELFALTHKLKIGTIADLIRYRLEHDKTVERVGECQWPTTWGAFRMLVYRDLANGAMHFALVKGVIRADSPVLVRVHMHDALRDLVETQRPARGWPLKSALDRVAGERAAVIVVLRPPEDADELVRQLKDYEMSDQGVEREEDAAGSELRTHGVGAQILADVGVGRMRVLGTPRRLRGVAAFGLTVDEYVPYD